MRRAALALALVLCGVLAAPAVAGPAGTYKGKATSLERDFNYGKVRVVVKGTKVAKVEIKAVTTTGCGGFMDVVFAPSDPETKIVSGSRRISGGKLSVKYRPVASIEDQTTTLKATFKGSKVTGTFRSGTICGNAGRFTARK